MLAIKKTAAMLRAGFIRAYKGIICTSFQEYLLKSRVLIKADLVNKCFLVFICILDKSLFTSSFLVSR